MKTMGTTSESERKTWAGHAKALLPRLIKKRAYPVSFIIISDSEAFSDRPAIPFQNGAWTPLEIQPGEAIVVRFSHHTVGHLHFRLGWKEECLHAPVRLNICLAESELEIQNSNKPFTGTLPSSWLQEETITIDRLDEPVVLPRRFAFSLVRLKVMGASAPIQLTDLYAETESSADFERLLPYESPDPLWRQIDETSVRTLANCMQSVMEDGPKRDRRLWLGDLRLQAMANSVTFRNHKLVERSLYLLASACDDSGFIPSCVFDTPKPVGACRILDYALLLGDILLHHARSYHRLEIVHDLYPLAIRQLDFFRKCLDDNGVFRDNGQYWLFVDWSTELNREATMQAIFIYALRRNAELARLLNNTSQAAHLEEEAKSHTAIMRSLMTVEGFIPSGRQKQLSYATHIWMILADVLRPAEAREILARLESLPSCVRPMTPYLWHHYVAACFHVGDISRACERLKTYWGGMIARGADTFWEVFKIDAPLFSPYADVRLNSLCHGWSCTPTFFLRHSLKSLTEMQQHSPRKN